MAEQQEHQVVVAGGGPTGSMLAGELALAGVDVVIVERRPDQHVEGSRAGGLHARTIEVLDQRGIAERFLDAGQVMQVQGFAMIPLDISDLASRHAHGLALFQSAFEPILADWVAGLGVPTRRPHDVVSVAQDDDGVDVGLDDGSRLRASYLVGCDGGRSTVRREAGIDFPGLEASTSWMIAEVQVSEEPAAGMRRDGAGVHGMARLGEDPDAPVRIVLTERSTEQTGRPSLDDLRQALRGIYDTDFGVHDPTWISRFTDTARQAAAYRSGRVLVAGDAAHVHAPTGGLGLNTGVQDAVNLGWKLAQVVQGTSPAALLDSYHDERHPVGEQVLHHTMAMVALNRPDDRSQALHATMAELLAFDEARRHLGGSLSGLAIRYDLGEGHPLVGWRVPDVDLQTASGPTRVFELLHEARPVLLVLDGTPPPALHQGVDRVRLVEATTEATWELPVDGVVPSPAAVLIRPDGHVAWAGDVEDPALPEALDRWFGASLAEAEAA